MGAELNLEDLVAPALVGPADQNFVLQTTCKGVADLAQKPPVLLVARNFEKLLQKNRHDRHDLVVLLPRSDVNVPRKSVPEMNGPIQR